MLEDKDHFCDGGGISWRPSQCSRLFKYDKKREKKIARKGAFENDIAGFFTDEKKMKNLHIRA